MIRNQTLMYALGVSLALIQLPASGAGSVKQTTTVNAPVTAIAIGRSRASVKINVREAGKGGSQRHVHVQKPVTAIALPGTRVVIEIK